MKCPICEESIEPRRARRPLFASVVAAVPSAVAALLWFNNGAEAMVIMSILLVIAAGLWAMIYFSSASGSRTEYKCPECGGRFSL